MKRKRRIRVSGLAIGCLLVLSSYSYAAQQDQPNPETGPALSDFKIIAERNIFNPKRYARSSNARRETPRNARSETLMLTGTMAYEKGRFAFFDGSSSSSRKVIKDEGQVAGLAVLRIEPESVTLAEGTNQLSLAVGHQLKRQEDGPWRQAGQAEVAYTPAPSRVPAPQQPASPQPEPEQGADFINRLVETAFEGGPIPLPPPGSPDGAPPMQIPLPPGTEPNNNGAQNIAPSPSPTTASPSSGGEDDILRRLRERREQEMNQ